VEHVTPTAFWSTVSIIAAAIGSSFLMTVSHADEPRHPDAAAEADVSEIKIQVTRVAADVDYNRRALVELKGEIKDLRIDQNRSSREILEAIRSD
jgi:Fe-S-cluster formation regulator IscX/YfhJ